MTSIKVSAGMVQASVLRDQGKEITERERTLVLTL